MDEPSGASHPFALEGIPFHTTEITMKPNLEAERLFEPVTTPAPANEYRREQIAMLANLHRLKAERLARESAPTSTAL
jgi:hypothetical protein